MASSIITQWSQLVDEATPEAQSRALGETDDIAKELLTVLLGHFERPLPPTYSEMTALLKRVYSECQALLGAFASEGKISKDRIPNLPSRIDPLGSTSQSFTLATAQQTVTKHFDALSSLLSKNATKNVLPSLKDRRNKVMVSIGRYGVMKERYDVQVMAGIGGALVALRVLPPKIGPVVKAIMDSIKVSLYTPHRTLVQICTDIRVERGEPSTSIAFSQLHRLTYPSLRVTPECRPTKPHRQSDQEPLHLLVPRYDHQPHFHNLSRRDRIAERG